MVFGSLKQSSSVQNDWFWTFLTGSLNQKVNIQHFQFLLKNLENVFEKKP